MSVSPSLFEQFGDIDVYLFDQLLKERITPAMRVLDAGCGDGRNVDYLLHQGADVFGVDTSPDAVAGLARRSASLPAISLSGTNVASASIRKTSSMTSSSAKDSASPLVTPSLAITLVAGKISTVIGRWFIAVGVTLALRSGQA